MALRSREHLLSWPSILSLEALVCSASTLNSDTKCIGDDTERPIYDTSKAGDACDTSPCTATECCKATSIGINTYSEHCEVLVRLGVLGRLGSFRLIRSPQEHYQKRSRIIRSPQESSRALTNHQEPSRTERASREPTEPKTCFCVALVFVSALAAWANQSRVYVCVSVCVCLCLCACPNGCYGCLG